MSISELVKDVNIMAFYSLVKHISNGMLFVNKTC